MAKLINYPRASFQAAYELAEAVQSLGGKSDLEVCAQKMGKKVSGGFQAIAGSAGKFGLITAAKGSLITTPLFKEIQLAYTEEESKALKLGAFLLPPVFKGLAEKFDGMPLPLAVLDKMLIKEFEVDDSIASTVAKYFSDGGKALGLIDAEGKVRLPTSQAVNTSQEDDADVIHTREVAPLEVLPPEDRSMYNRRQNDLDNHPTAYTPHVEVPSDDRRKIQIPLPQKRMAELIVPDEMTIKDLEVIRMQLEVLRVFIENS
jgi:hypothetical protein